MRTLPSIDEMRRAHVARDASYDGIFFLGVSTTGIFCRPSCPARQPLAANVRYFATSREALFAGYRPCLRCRPLETDGRPPEWVATVMAALDRAPAGRLKDAELHALGLDPARVRRHFLRHHGMTFQAYARARRLGDALGELREGASLDDVALAHGYESHSGFRDAFVRTFGRPPGRARTSDAQAVRVCWIESPLGPLVAGATDRGVCLLEFTDRRMLEAQFASLRRVFSSAIVPGRNAHLDRLVAELARYFAGTLQCFELPLDTPGTPFQTRVWEELCRIPYGQTRSYQELAQTLGKASLQRAVGRANGMNRVAIVIPCHRVVNRDGSLGGYGGGLWRKRFLLDLEQTQRASCADAR
jgi:AraC family transcriptional regulator of adaptative response/methylated-DNA-[protein]-cysteine methyltransferase